MALQAQCLAKIWQYKGNSNMTFKWFSHAKQHGRISVDFASIYTYSVWATLSVGIFLFLCAYAIIVLQTAQVPESGKVAIFLCIVISLAMTVAILFYFLSESKDPGRCFSNSTEAAGILYTIASVCLSLIFSMLLSDDKEYGVFPIVLNKEAMKGYYLPMCSLAGILFLGIASVIFRTTKKLVTTLKDINGLYARYCYIYEKMPEYAKRKGRVLNQHGVTVEAEEEFQAFMNSCHIFCSLPREERDPLKWDKKNIGRYFSL